VSGRTVSFMPLPYWAHPLTVETLALVVRPKDVLATRDSGRRGASSLPPNAPVQRRAAQRTVRYNRLGAADDAFISSPSDS
jgi:hypothetical protein